MSSPSKSASKKRKLAPDSKQNELTLQEKINVLRDLKDKMSQRAIAAKYGIGKGTVSRIAAAREMIEQEAENNTDLSAKRIKRTSKADPINRCVLYFFRKCRGQNIPITGVLLQEKAKFFAESFGIDNFAASNGWLQRFRERNQLNLQALSGESADVDLAAGKDWMAGVLDLVAGYEPADIFNADESGFFYRQLPTKSLVEKGQSARGGKLAKERLSVLFCCSSTGEKLTPLVIGNSARPRAFKKNNVTADKLPVIWKNNKKAWMTSVIFNEWMDIVNDLMRRQKRRIVILLDNASSHPDVKRPHVKLLFLHPNLTSVVQPLDQEIIKTAKALFRKQLLTYLINRADDILDDPNSGGSATALCKEVNVYDAIKWITVAWNEVEAMTITKCFRRCGIFFPVAEDAESEAGETGGLQEVVVFEGTEALPGEMREELMLVTEDEYVSFDNGVQCREAEGDTVEEIAQLIVEEVLLDQKAELSTEPTLDKTDDDDNDEEDLIEIEIVPGFKIDTHQDAQNALAALESYCFRSESSNIPLVFQMQKNFNQEKMQARLTKLKRMVQTTINSFMPK